MASTAQELVFCSSQLEFLRSRLNVGRAFSLCMRGEVPIPEWHILRGTGDDFGPSRHEQWGSAGGEQAATARPAIRKLVWCGTYPSALTALLLMLVTDVVQKVPMVMAVWGE